MPATQTEPQSRERSKVRLPLDHHETEAIARRIHILLCTDAMSDDERGNLIKKYRELRKVDYPLSRRFPDRPLPAMSLRPKFYDDHSYLTANENHSTIIRMVGWVFRLREHVERLELKYFGNDDI